MPSHMRPTPVQNTQLLIIEKRKAEYKDQDDLECLSIRQGRKNDRGIHKRSAQRSTLR